VRERLRIVFCGTPQFAVPTLKHLLANHEFEVLAVFSQPDRPRGRGHEVSYSPVKEVALAANLPVHQPEKIRSPEAQNLLQKLAPHVIVIIAYGQIIPSALLSVPKFGWINLHAGLLPKYRGAAPINWAIVNGETRTGATAMRIDAGVDTGDILLQREIDIGPAETAPELTVRLSELGAPLMAETLRGLAASTIAPRPQDHAKATHAPILKKEDGRIDWNRPAQEIYNRMRGFAPWPGAYTTFRGQSCHVWGEPIENSGFNENPGHFVILNKPEIRMFVVCGSGSAIRLTRVKLEGRKEVSPAEFFNGARLKTGERFGDT
jgi:methionyl-tRNA formyltransferase